MRFDELATFFARLEASGRRLGALQLVADLLAHARPDELAPIVYLLQGQLRPPYEGVELGLGERLLLRAIARANDLTEAALTRQYRGLGDLGLGYALRFPRMLDGVRTDRAPEDATTEREILDLHRMQRR